MHYVRLLKPPTLSPALSKTGQPVLISTKVTITTDLGDSFLLLPLSLSVSLLDEHGQSSPFQNHEWKGGSRHLEISFSVARNLVRELKWPCRLVVTPAEEGRKWDIGENGAVLRAAEEEGEDGRVVGVESELISPQPGLAVERRVRRKVAVVRGQVIYVWEEMGESIARHIWDAGLILSATLAQLTTPSVLSLPNPSPFLVALPLLHEALLSKSLRILELGTGVGIVGNTLANCLPNVSVILTDLTEAAEIVRYNISNCSLSNVSYENLDWSSPLPLSLQKQKFDLVIISDCTYNPDVVPDLVSTVRRIVQTSAKALIVVAMKFRHESESVFFTLMAKNHLAIVEKAVLPLPHLGEEDQQIEVYLFKGEAA